MPDSLDEFAREILSGRDRSLKGRAIRGVLGAVEPVYAAAMRVRNRLYDHHWLRSHFLGRPAISVGNLTAGGTGKTPVVQWLAQSLRKRGHRPAILLRGYMRDGNIHSDEAMLLGEALNDRAGQADVEVEANPDRLAGARQVLARSPQTDVFLLDDGFQHRRAQRQFDLVLIDATSPFGFNHVHPRGLMREPKRGLQRAGGVLLTRYDLVTRAHADQLRAEIRRWNRAAPIYACSHRHTALLSDTASPSAMDELGRTRFFAFSGIAQPKALDTQLLQWGQCYAGGRWFSDHHTYTRQDMDSIIAEASSRKAQLLVTTGKDWVKLAPWRSMCEQAGLPLRRLGLSLVFEDGDEQRLLDHIEVSAFGGSA